MVSSQILDCNNTNVHKAFKRQLILPMDPPDFVLSEHLEFDFSDVFGPSPTQTSIDINAMISDGAEPSPLEGKVYSEPMVILSRSHSLVGPTACVCQSPCLCIDTLDETELELVECASGASGGDQEKPSTRNAEEHEDLSRDEKVESVGLEDFDFLKVVGQGVFGKVFQVMKKGTSEIYAMKVVRKDKIIEKNHSEYMKAERDILTKVDHSFIVQLRYSFQVQSVIQYPTDRVLTNVLETMQSYQVQAYLVLDFVNGGHLFFQLYHHGLFREDLAHIYTAEIVSAVSHLHANGIMHRDLKPENILLDADGHVMLTDFGLAKQFEENTRSNSMCGTVEYMAPEIILGKGRDKAADWWSIGVLLFEMLTGKPPFIGGNHGKIQQKIVKDKIKLPAYLSSEAHSLLKGLLQKEPSKRLGSGPGGSDEIKKHKWLKSINWKKLDAWEIQPSFRPNVWQNLHCKL